MPRPFTRALRSAVASDPRHAQSPRALAVAQAQAVAQAVADAGSELDAHLRVRGGHELERGPAPRRPPVVEMLAMEGLRAVWGYRVAPVGTGLATTDDQSDTSMRC